MIGNFQQQCCCDNNGETGPETGTPVTDCPPFTTPVNQIITVNVTAKPTMWCPVTSVACESFDWCENHPGIPTVAVCYGQGPQSGEGPEGGCQNPPFFEPIIGPSPQIPKATWINDYDTFTACNFTPSGFNKDAPPPCVCDEYVPCSTASYVERPFSPRSASAQFNFSTSTESIPVFQSNPSDSNNNVSISVSIISFCEPCTCSPGLFCSKISVGIGATWQTIIPTFSTTVGNGFDCVAVPYLGHIESTTLLGEKQHDCLQTAVCTFERVITTSQTNARMARGSYQPIFASTLNPPGDQQAWNDTPPCDPNGIQQSAECGPSVAQILTNAGFTIDCTVS